MVLNNPLFVSRNSRSSSYQIEQSLRFDGATSASRTPSSAGNRRTWTFSFWLKRAALTGDQTILMTPKNSGYSRIDINSASGSSVNFLQYNGSSYDFKVALSINRLRDPSAWYHIVVSVDTTQSTASNRVKFYVNGSLETDLNPSSNTYPSQNFDIELNGTGTHYLGLSINYGLARLNGYLAEVNYIDGSQLAATDFGEYDDNGVWRPIEYSGSYTGNSYYLKFDAADVMGDSSGLSNDWSGGSFVTSGAGTDVMSDTPTNNFATLNPLEPASASAGTLSQGNLYIASQDYSLQKATFRFGGGGPTTGKYYWEVTHSGGTYTSYIGVTSNLTQDAGEIAGGGDKSWFGNNTSRKYTGSTASYTHTYSSGDVHGYAIDLDAQEFKFYVNGTLKLTDTTLPDPATTVLVPFQFTTNSGGAGWSSTSWNFGQRAFSHQPTGYSSLCTANLPAPTVKDGSKNFNTVLWTGNATDNRAITGVGFQPSWTWIKTRSAADNHSVHDEVRGANRQLFTNSTDYEFTSTTLLKSFDSDGFTLGTDSSVNGSGRTFVAWNWLASNTSGSSNTAGSITSTVSANSTAGFSIVSYTGTGSAATVGHGLGVAAKMIIVKRRTSSSNNWYVYHEELGNTKALSLNTTGAASTANFWNNTSPTSTVFNLGNLGDTNLSSMIAYCFAEVEGYSKFGIYRGNSNSDGPFTFCGFKPRWLMIKSTSAGGWFLFDTERDRYNVSDASLQAELASAESSSYLIDILSNGFKIRTTNTSLNYSVYDYIFAAFAENPFGGSGVSPATAR